MQYENLLITSEVKGTPPLPLIGLLTDALNKATIEEHYIMHLRLGKDKNVNVIILRCSAVRRHL